MRSPQDRLPNSGCVRSTGAPRTLCAGSTGVSIKDRCGSTVPEWTFRGRFLRAVAKIRNDLSKAVLVLPMGCTEEEPTLDGLASVTNMTLNKVVLPAGESVYQDARGQPMPPGRWPTEFHYVDGCLERVGATDFNCVNRVIEEPCRQCLAVFPVDISDSVDLLSDEELDLV